VELWILISLVAAGIAFALYSKFIRRRRVADENNGKDIYPLW
jgi:hypothetical protein